MSGPVADRRPRRRLALVAVCALACAAAAQEPPRQPTDPNAKKLDAKAPLPADRPGRAAHDKFAVPNTDRAMFAKIEDFKPVAAQDQNRAEYDAWCEVVSHARQFSAAELEAHAARDVTVIELRKSLRSTFRAELVRFDGQVVCARRLDAPKHFKDNPELGVTELYEVRLIPDGASPLEPVSVVFTELPAALAAVKDGPMRKDDKGESLGAGEWVVFNDKDGKYAGPKVWVAAAGYYFKLMNMPGDEGNKVVPVPVLIGKSVTPLPGPPAPPGNNPVAIDANMRIFKHIKDEVPLFYDAEGMELAAYTRVLIHAHRFTPEKLEEHANKDVKFADLFLETRATYRLQPVRFEGRLISLKKKVPNPEMLAAGINQVYEGWLVPANEPRGNPVRIDFIDPVEGVEPGPGRVNKWVSFAGYSFKKFLYESSEEDPNRKGKNLFKFAPLLLGKGTIARRDPDAPDNVTWPTFVLWAILGGVALIASAGVLTWYYRGGDRKAKEAAATVRGKNPFDAAATNTTGPADGPVRPSGEW